MKFRTKFIFRLFLKILLNIFKLLFLKFSNFGGGEITEFGEISLKFRQNFEHCVAQPQPVLLARNRRQRYLRYVWSTTSVPSRDKLNAGIPWKASYPGRACIWYNSGNSHVQEAPFCETRNPSLGWPAPHQGAAHYHTTMSAKIHELTFSLYYYSARLLRPVGESATGRA